MRGEHFKHEKKLLMARTIEKIALCHCVQEPQPKKGDVAAGVALECHIRNS